MTKADLTGGQAQPAPLDKAGPDGIRITLGELCLAHAVSVEHVRARLKKGGPHHTIFVGRLLR